MKSQPYFTELQHHPRWLRRVAALVLVTFTSLILEPVAIAAHAENRATPVQSTHVSDESRLSETVRRVQQRSDDMLRKLEHKEETRKEQDDLYTLRQELSTLDRRAMSNFEQVGAMLKQKNVPEIILKRHADTVKQYRAELEKLLTELDGVNNARFDSERQKSLATLRDGLKAKQHQRSRPSDKPDDLPNKLLKPDSKRKPKETTDAFKQAGLHSNPNVRLAALGDFKFDQLAGANDPAYLAATTEVTLSDVIRAKAAELNYDPVTIYHFVRNQIDWQPAWGAMQNADLTLASKRGNAIDIANLLIALLRASGFPARYVHGTIDVPEAKFRNWAGGFESVEAAMEFAASAGIPIGPITSGGKITKVRLEHIWVEAAIDFDPSRGAINRSADNWIALDASYKQHTFQAGLDAIAISGIDPTTLANSFVQSGTVNETEGWVSGFDPSILNNAQTQAQTALQNYITQNLPNATVGDILGGRKAIIEAFPTLPSSMANTIVATGARYGMLPSSLQHRIDLAFSADLYGEPINPVSFPWSQLNNQKITLSFKPATPEDEQALNALLPNGPITDLSQLPSSIPAYLIHVVPELALNGQVIKTGNPMRLGEELPFTFGIAYQGQNLRPYTYPVIAGSYLSVAIIGGSVSPTILQSLQTKVTATKTTLESGDTNLIGTLTREDLLGDLFYAGTLGYYAQLTTLASIMAQQNKTHHYLAAGYGTFGYEPNVDYFFGIPRTISAGGVAMNVPMIAVVGANTADATKKKNFAIQVGTLSSALEHAVPEQMFATDPLNPPDAISAVKALSKASAAGQRIYQLTKTNQATTLPNIHHDPATMQEIQAALAVGKEVITHTDAVSVPGWSGAGYIILDPVTGEGAYKIGGGQNGSSIDPGDLALGLGALAGGGDAYSRELISDGLPLSEDLPRIKLAKTIAKAAGFLGAATTLVEIYGALDGLGDGSTTSYQVLGRLSLLLFGWAVGGIGVAAIASTFLPISAAIAAIVFVAALSFLLAEFSAIYLSFRSRGKATFAFLSGGGFAWIPSDTAAKKGHLLT